MNLQEMYGSVVPDMFNLMFGMNIRIIYGPKHIISL